MAECHRCPHYEDVKAGKYDSVQWSKTPCCRCTKAAHTRAAKEKAGSPASLKNHGLSRISIDRIPGHEIAVDDREPLHRKPAPPDPPGLKQCIEFVREYVRLTPNRRDILALYLLDPGMTYKDMGKCVGVSTQAAQQHLATLRNDPVLGQAIIARSKGSCKKYDYSMIPRAKRLCPLCGRTFKPKSVNQKFCTKACQKKNFKPNEGDTEKAAKSA